MQRMIETTLVKKILDKYESRYNECVKQYENDLTDLQQFDLKASVEMPHYEELERRDFLLDDISSLNSQISAYECIIRDLKGIIK